MKQKAFGAIYASPDKKPYYYCPHNVYEAWPNDGRYESWKEVGLLLEVKFDRKNKEVEAVFHPTDENTYSVDLFSVGKIGMDIISDSVCVDYFRLVFHSVKVTEKRKRRRNGKQAIGLTFSYDETSMYIQEKRKWEAKG